VNEFLGPHGKATVILMTSHFESELPKLKDLKRLLQIPDGKYYKSHGRNSQDVNRLERVLNIMSEIQGAERDWYRHRSTDYLVTVAEVHSNLFMTLKYTAQVVDGFNLTTACLKELEALISKYSEICSMRGDIETMWEVLKRNSSRASDKGIEDSSILNPDIPALKKVLTGYGDTHHALVAKEIQDWYAAYRWKVKAPSSNSGDDINAVNQDDETEVEQTT
jgi:hypothetical protein